MTIRSRKTIGSMCYKDVSLNKFFWYVYQFKLSLYVCNQIKTNQDIKTKTRAKNIQIWPTESRNMLAWVRVGPENWSRCGPPQLVTLWNYIYIGRYLSRACSTVCIMHLPSALMNGSCSNVQLDKPAACRVLLFKRVLFFVFFSFFWWIHVVFIFKRCYRQGRAGWSKLLFSSQVSQTY